MTTNQIERALTADREDVGPLICAAVEDQWFERKSARVNAKDLAAPMIAFANAEGGTLVIGVHDGKVDGI